MFALLDHADHTGQLSGPLQPMKQPGNVLILKFIYIYKWMLPEQKKEDNDKKAEMVMLGHQFSFD